MKKLEIAKNEKRERKKSIQGFLFTQGYRITKDEINIYLFIYILPTNEQ